MAPKVGTLLPIPKWIRVRELAKRCKLKTDTVAKAMLSRKSRVHLFRPTVHDLEAQQRIEEGEVQHGEKTSHLLGPTTEDSFAPWRCIDIPATSQYLEPTYAFATRRAAIFPHTTAARFARSIGRVPIFETEDPDVRQEELRAALPASKMKIAERASVFTLLGERDHGKTSLADALRNDGAVTHERGKITQHVKPHIVQSPSCPVPSSPITLLDTPGHEQFFELREEASFAGHGAIVVVACDEGPTPASEAAFSLVEQMQLPAVVALTKSDLVHQSQISEVTDALFKYCCPPSTPVIPISSTMGHGMEHLWDEISSMQKLTAKTVPSNGLGRATVLDVVRHSRRGVTFRIVLHEGSISPRDWFLSGLSVGSVRGLLDASGAQIKLATPGMVVDVMVSYKQSRLAKRAHLARVPAVPRLGEGFWVLPESVAISLLEQRFMGTTFYSCALHAEDTSNELKPDSNSPATDAVASEEVESADDNGSGTLVAVAAENLELEHEEREPLPVVVKADSAASLETIASVLETLSLERSVSGGASENEIPVETVHCDVCLAHSGVGKVTAVDMQIAAELGVTKIYCFNVDIGHSKLRPLLEDLDLSLVVEPLLPNLVEKIALDCCATADPVANQ